jgi:hypothetical protein
LERQVATGLSVGATLVCVLLGSLWSFSHQPRGEALRFCLLVVFPVGISVGYLLRSFFLRGQRRRKRILAEPFSPLWETILASRVVFYIALGEEEKTRFRRDLQLFLGEKRITGIGTEVDEICRVLSAASAVISVFGFPQWEWDHIGEILVYPSAFGRDFQPVDATHPGGAIGMVGNEALDRVMILSKPDLIHGFTNTTDKRNVGIHEFAHLVDRADGNFDGVPKVGLSRDAIGPWMELVRREMVKIESRRSLLDRYGATNPTEFFAVASEVFFETPELLKKKHPELYEALTQVFRQDTASRLKGVLKSMLRPGGDRLGRNSRCPCGSGKKYKRCCLGIEESRQRVAGHRDI